VKVGVWGATALLVSACTWTLLFAVPELVGAIRGVAVESIPTYYDPYIVIAYALLWCGVFFGGVWGGQVGTRIWSGRPSGKTTSSCGGSVAGCASMLGLLAVVWVVWLVARWPNASGPAALDIQPGPYAMALTAICAIPTVAAAYTAYVSHPPLEVRARSKRASIVFWAVIVPLAVVVGLLLRFAP